MTDVTPHLTQLHESYCFHTKRPLPITSKHLWAWEIWKAKGFTVDDLKIVVAHINKLIGEKRRRPESFRFHNLIEDTDRFSEDLCEAKASNRVTRYDSGKQSVLKATGRPTDPPPRPVRTAADILAGDEAFKKFLQMRDGI